MVFQANFQSSDCSSLGKSILEDQHQGINVDFILSSGGEKVLVHSIMIRNSSPMLKALLHTSCTCSQPNAILLPQEYSSVLSHFVALLYMGSSFLPKNLVPQLKELALLLGIANVSLDHQYENVLGSRWDVSEDEAEDNNISIDEKEGNRPTPMKLSTETSRQGHKSFNLSLPNSRTNRDFSDFKHDKSLTGLPGRVQEEYNMCPVGKYAGPYDLNEKLDLNILLPNSNLNYSSYSEFVHPENVSCGKFNVGKNYEKLNDLDKIDALSALVSDNDSSDDQESDEDEEDTNSEKVYYTCLKKKCRIPCPCAPCCTGEKQCTEHKIKHLQLFDEKERSIVIRSSEDFCRDNSFFDTNFIIKYSGIPLSCLRCQKDLLHHKMYHLSFHDDCKFCKQNWYKLFATDKEDLHKREKKEKYHYRSVCPHCDKQFCEPASAKKHIELKHNPSPFSCKPCNKMFQSKQAKEYHNNIKHSTTKASEKCDICDKDFASKTSLQNHKMYVHTDERKFKCKSCDQKFKQKKSLKNHYLQVHRINQFKEVYHEPESEQRYPCGQCESVYKQKKNLNQHLRQKHNQDLVNTVLICDKCPSKFTQKKSLIAHIKCQHGEPSEEFKCTHCGKVYNQKKNLNRHMLIHRT